MRRPAAWLAVLAVAVAVAAGPAAAPARAQTAGRRPSAPRGALVEPESYDRPPPGRSMTAREALAIAAAVPKVRAARAAHARPYARVYLAAGGRWQVSWFEPPTRAEPQRRRSRR